MAPEGVEVLVLDIMPANWCFATAQKPRVLLPLQARSIRPTEKAERYEGMRQSKKSARLAVYQAFTHRRGARFWDGYRQLVEHDRRVSKR